MTLKEKLDQMMTGLSNKPCGPDLGTPPSRDSDDTCPICGGDEWIFERGDDGCLYCKPCKCREQAVLKRRLRFANIPDTFKDMRLNTFRADIYRQPEGRRAISIACKLIKEYLDGFGEALDRGLGLYIHSAAKGSGKTRIAASIANELMHNKGAQVKFAVSTEILNEIKRTWDKGSEYTESQLLDDLSLAEVLVIDDFGTETVTGWVSDKFYHIINERYINHKVTIFTSNESLDTLQYDDRIVSRIKEMTYQIQFPEESVRDYIAERNKQELLQRVGGTHAEDI